MLFEDYIGRNLELIDGAEEPLCTGSAYLLDHDLAVIADGPAGVVPVATVSARVIERTVTHGPELEGLLLERIARRGGGGVVDLRSIGSGGSAENPVLVDAWASYA